MAGRRSTRRFWGPVLGSIVLVLAGGLTVAPASAQLYGPIPANASGEPTYDFTDQDSIWTYVRSDIAGGVICIVPAATTVESGSCTGALGGENHLVGIGTLYALISGHGIPAGNYRLLVENSAEEPTEVSEVFTVTACPDCPKDPDAAIVEAWKGAARGLGGEDGSMTRMCQLTGVLEQVAGKAVRARSMVDPPGSTGPLAAEGPSFIMTMVGGTVFAMYNPAAVNIQKGLDIQKALACGAQKMFADQAADPPDPNFGTVAQPQARSFDRLGPVDLDAVSASIERQRALGVAMLHGYERYLGARQAGDTDAQVRQLRAAGGFAGGQADELEATAAALRTWSATAAADEELSGVMLTAAERDDLVAAYTRVRTSGFVASELDELHSLGYTDPQIAVIRSLFTSDVASIPVDTTYGDALNQVAADMEEQVQAYRDFGLELLVVASRIEEAYANHPPTADDLAVNASTGRPAPVTLTGSDADDDPITFEVVEQPDHGTLTGSGASRVYTSEAGFTGVDTFTYVAKDAESSSAPATVTVTVEQRPNTAPTAGDVAVTTPGAPVAVDLVASDPEGDALSYEITQPPAHGSLSGTAPHLTYAPAAGYVGPDTVRYRASDGLLQSNAGTISITVTSPVELHDDALRVDPDGVVDVLGNDASTSPLTVISTTNGAHGSATCGPLGGCTYRAQVGYIGTDEFTYTARDSEGRTSSATVDVEVTERPGTARTGPGAADDRGATTSGTPIDLSVLGNDSGTGLRVVSATDPPHGTAVCGETTCRYTPDPGFSGYDGFGYTVADDGDATGSGHVDLTVAPAGAHLEVRMSGRPATPDGPNDTEVQQGEAGRWGASVVASPPMSEDAIAALARPTGSARASGPHTLAPGSVSRAEGFAAVADGDGISFSASTAAVIGNRITRPIPRPLPPISQGTGGDGHVPILVGTKVFAFFHHSSPTSVTCVDRATGRLCPGYPRTLWQLGTSDINGPAAVVDGRIYTHLLPSSGSQSWPIALYCWDTRTDATCGLEVVGRTGDSARSQASAPVLVGGRIYLGAQTGRVYCFDPATSKACATSSAPSGIPAGDGTYMDAVAHADRAYFSSSGGRAACVVVPSMQTCSGWSSAKTFTGWNLVTQHSAVGAAVGVCVVSGPAAACVRDDGQESTLSGFPMGDGYYGNTQEGETGVRTFVASLGRGGLGCWDWSTLAGCAGAAFDEGGWAGVDTSGDPLPSAYGTTWDGGCLVALGDPGRVFTMDPDGNAPCTSLSTGSSLEMDLRDQRCDGTVGAAAWGQVSLLESDATGTELRSVRIRVVDAVTGAELLTGELIGTGTLSLAGISPAAHPSLRVEAAVAAHAGDLAWADHVPPRVALTWAADPLQACFTTTTVVDCAQPLLASLLVRGVLGAGGSDEASLTVRRADACAAPPPPTPTPPPPSTVDNPDRDGDGLLNTRETELGTNPDDADTDDDGLGDGAEVTGIVVKERFEVCGGKTRRSIVVTPSPLKSDTDRDGLSDGLEVTGYVIKQKVITSNKGASYVIGLTRTDPTRRDTDRDRLTDKEERTGSANKRWNRHKTDPSQCDTDSGALSDGIEVQHLSDPADFRSGPGDPGTIPMGGQRRNAW